MPFFIGIILIAILVFLFRKVRQGRISFDFQTAVKHKVAEQKRKFFDEGDVWTKNAIRDTRETRTLRCNRYDDAPSYQSYISDTLEIKKLQK